MGEEFTSFEVSKRLGIPYGRLREWIIKKYITPSMLASGQGYKSSFAKEDAYYVKLFEYLLDLGFSRMAASEQIKSMKRTGPGLRSKLLACTYIVYYRQKDGNYVTAFEDKQAFTMDLRGHTFEGKEGLYDDAVVVNFSKIRSDVDSKLA